MAERKVTVIEPVIKKAMTASNDTPAKIKVAAYARVSTEMDEQQSSYETQVAYYTQYINGNPDWEFAGVYADRGITGTSLKNRDRFNQMVNDALNHKIDLILTKSISRFARNTVDTLQTVRKLKEAKVEVVFEKENLRTFDPKCEMMLTIMSSLAQEENVRWGIQKSMQDGKVRLLSSLYGYRKGEDGEAEIDEAEAKVVRYIFKAFTDGTSARHIARNLTRKGIPTPMGKKNWSVNTIQGILQNEKYKGDALLQKYYTEDYLTKKLIRNNGERKQYYVENSHPAIIKAEDFDKVQELLEKQAPYAKKKRDTSPYCNKLICGECGEFYGHKVWRNYHHVERNDIWYCNARYKGTVCKTPVIEEAKLDEAFAKLSEELGIDPAKEGKYAWRKYIDNVTMNADNTMSVRMDDQKEIRIAL